ncbi:ATP-binding protein [Paraburkholderia ferrariae]|uniref:ATP-binding protein n=1 Tax=Paraburkholderia ferrariae TaxID=386056 RepID=UPI0004827455|nr:ATP-binding protein [Paraburkholderia ferrariae]
MATINLKKFIAEHYRGGVTVRDVIREALTNSIHAGGKLISVELHFSERNGDLFQSTEERKVLEQIIITDDGEGFTPENLHYFEEVCTGHKDDIGGKGVGRLAFLKYARTVEIYSQMSDERVEFLYTPDFKPDDVKRTRIRGSKSTRVTLSDLKDKINTQVAKLVNSICDDLRLILFLKARQGHEVKLRFTHNSRQPFDDVFEFSGADIKALAEREFQLDGEVFKCYLFREEPPKKGIVAMLCADELCIEECTISKRFDICRHLIFVTAAYFNGRSNLERQRLELPKTDDDVDMISPLSRDRIIFRIREECMSMINESPEGGIEEFKSSNIAKLRKYYPFIKVDALGGNAALLDADEMVKTYRMQQARKEDQLMEALEVGKSPSLDDVSHLASDDLARFIVHRALVIDSLANVPLESAESIIHNAILPKRSDGAEIRENNVWLVDDKFLSYSSIYSDETLATIIEGVTNSVGIKQGRKPDVAAFFSKNSENQPNKLVIIEFKKPGADLFDNNKALVQCRLYASELADHIPTVREVFAFSIVDIDDEFYRDMKQQNFMDIFSLTERVVYRDFMIGASNIPLHLYVMPASALVTDAKARNRVFEEVLQFNMTK